MLATSSLRRPEVFYFSRSGSVAKGRMKLGKMGWKESLRRGITVNRGMVLIKVVYCTAYLGLVILLPYLTLQALTLGLTYEDISIIYGITPALTFMTSPLSGKKRPMPLAGDKMVGEKVFLSTFRFHRRQDWLPACAHFQHVAHWSRRHFIHFHAHLQRVYEGAACHSVQEL